MGKVTERSPMHQRILLTSYVLGSLASLLGSLAAIYATLEKNELKYPNINGPNINKETNDSSKRYFDL